MSNILDLKKILTKNFPKSKLYLVGGTVRDKFLKRKSNDCDAVVTSVPLAQLEKLLRKHGNTKLIGKAFGVIKWKNVDIALPRQEHGWGTGKRRDFDVQFNENLPIKMDLKRRDFTINAIAYDTSARKYIDYYKGLKDLKKRTIRTVGKPEDRFKEDVSRILRAVRFACQFNFEIDPKTWQAIKKFSPQVNQITKEIAAQEIVKAFAWNPIKALELFEKSGLLKILIPKLLLLKKCTQPKKYHSEGDVWTHTKLALKHLLKIKKTRLNPTLAFAVLLHDIGKPKTKKIIDRSICFRGHAKAGADIAKKIITRLKLESAGVNKNNLVCIIKHHLVHLPNPNQLKNTTIEKYFLNTSNIYSSLLTLLECDDAASIPCTKRPDNKLKILKKRIAIVKKQAKKPLLDGNEIMRILKIKSGPKVGRLIKKLREAQLSNIIKTKKQAIKLLKNRS